MISSFLFFPFLLLTSNIPFRHFKRTEILLLLFCGASAILYFGALFNFYSSASILVRILFVAAALISLFRYKTRLNLQDWAEIALVSSVAALPFLYSFQLNLWDEFTHWGIVQKILKVTGALSLNIKYDTGASYIQGLSLWIEFLSSRNPADEHTLYSASSCFLVSFILIVSRALTEAAKSVHIRILTGLTLLTAFFWLSGFSNDSTYTVFVLYSDFPMAVFLTGAVVSLFLVDLQLSFLLLLTSVLLLTLTKHMGFFFSGVFVCLWILNFWGRAGRKQILFKAALLLSAIFITKYSWDIHLLQASIPKYFNENKFSAASLVSVLVHPAGDPLLMLILSKAWLSLKTNWLLRIPLAGIFLLACYRRLMGAKPAWLHFFFFVVSFSAYLCLLLLSYRFLFGEYEATRLASFDRYVNTLLLPWSFGVFAMIGAIVIPLFDRFQLKKPGMVVFFALISYALVKQVNLQRLTADHKVEMRGIIKAETSKLKKVIKPGEKVYLLWQYSDGFYCYLSRYELYPNEMSMEGWSVGEPKSKDDVWTLQITQEELLSRVSGYDYLWVADDGGTLWKDYGKLFDNQKPGFFKIEKASPVAFRYLDIN